MIISKVTQHEWINTRVECVFILGPKDCILGIMLFNNGGLDRPRDGMPALFSNDTKLGRIASAFKDTVNMQKDHVSEIFTLGIWLWQN